MTIYVLEGSVNLESIIAWMLRESESPLLPPLIDNGEPMSEATTES